MFSKSLLATIMLTVSLPVLAGTPALDKRETHQVGRIEQGAKSGQLNAAETHRLVRGERRLNRNEAAAKADGAVTARERARLQSEANRMSDRIYLQKHDAQVKH
jgi:hypothetical protein